MNWFFSKFHFESLGIHENGLSEVSVPIPIENENPVTCEDIPASAEENDKSCIGR